MVHPCDPHGHLDTAAVAAKDEVLKQLLAEGLDMEILSYKIYVEEPTACILISNALNNANKVALKTTTIAALSVLTGAVGIASTTGKLNFDVIKCNLRATLDDMVDDPDFIHMFDFVVKMGADQNTYLPDFFKFTSKCVSSQFRQLRLQTFDVLTKLEAGPLSKIAFAKRSLRMKPVSTMCPPPEAELAKRQKWEFDLLEALLFHFHKKGGAAVAASIPEGEQILFFAGVDYSAADAFVKVPTGDSNQRRQDKVYKAALVDATAKYWDKIRGSSGSTVGPNWPGFQASLDASAVADKAKSYSGEPVQLAEPVLIRYDEATGCALGETQTRTVVHTDGGRIRLPWYTWLESDVATNLGSEAEAEAVAKVVLQGLHRDACSGANVPPIDVLFDTALKANVVVATEKAQKGSIELAPCVPKTLRLRTESTHPDRICLKVTERVNGVTVKACELFVHPEWQSPEDATVRQATHAVACEHKAWTWTGKESMHPYWAVQRLSSAQLTTRFPKGARFNMELLHKELAVVTVIGAANRTFVVRVPFLTNSIDIQEGVELLWECASKPKKAASTSVDWKHDQKLKEAAAVKEAKKRKVDAAQAADEI